MTDCCTRELIAQRGRGAAPLWDSIHTIEHWDVVHCYNTALPEWLMVILRRHVEAIDELNDGEAAEADLLIRQLSVILKEITGSLKTCVLQFAENSEH